MTHPKGWIEDDPGALPAYEDRIGAEPLDSPPRPRPPVWEDLYQVGESCMWNGGAHVRYAFTGEKTSPYPGHWYSRALRHPSIARDPEGSMPDEGLRVTDYLLGCEKSGTCAPHLYGPGVEGFSIHKKPFGAAMQDAQRWKPDMSLVYGLGDGLVNAADEALDRLELPLIGFGVDDAFEHFDGNGVIRGLSGDGPGHLATLWDKVIVNGERLFKLLNPWHNWAGGKTWALVDEDFVRSARQLFVAHGGRYVV